MNARFDKSGDGYILAVDRLLRHPPAKVWRALTERDLIKEWFPADIEGGWAVGQSLQFTFFRGEGVGLSEEDMRGTVLAADAERLLEFSWGQHVIRIELAEHPDGCRLTLSEAFGNPGWGARNAAGWAMCLDNLALLVQGAAVVEFAWARWQELFDAYVLKFEAAFGPQEGAPDAMDAPPPEG